MKRQLLSLAAFLATTFVWGDHYDLPQQGRGGTEIVPLSTLDLTHATNGWGTIHPDLSINSQPLTIAGNTYASGLGVHAHSRIVIKLNGAVTRFVAQGGIDDEAGDYEGYGIVRYRVVLRGEDGHEVVRHDAIARRGEPAVDFDIDVNGWKYLILEVSDGNGSIHGDHFDWANAYFEYQEQNSSRPEIVEAAVLESPLACATTVFSLPGAPFMHKIRTLDPTLAVRAEGLPEGLRWNARRKLVEGRAPKAAGQYHYTLVAGAHRERVSLTVDARLQQPTPLMGWLSWNVVEGDISQQVVEEAADAMVRQGLKKAGYRYLVLDDLWHAPARNADGTPREDPKKFPKGMKAAADYVHRRGLKFGIYSDAAPRTCAGAYGSLGYETVDARQYAAWGVDLLKYDYCHAPADRATAEERYRVMGDALRASGRDILLYMCEWGVREPWKWGASTGATTWRATYDTRDCWRGAQGGIGILESIHGMKDIWAYSGVNRFNDADMMCVGIHGTGRSSSDLCATGPGMTQDEYRTQFALWCMWSSPLTLSFDMTKPLSKDDLAILTNRHLIAVDQDALGQQAELVGERDGIIYFAKDLANGDVAISATNLNDVAATAQFRFADIPALDASATYRLRNLWTGRRAGKVQGTLSATLAPHATAVYRLSR